MKQLVIVILSIAVSVFNTLPASANDADSAKKPLIGINTDIEGERPEECRIQSGYVDAIKKAGGIPILLPPMPADDLQHVMAHLDGVMMIGGADYPPSLYHQDAHSSVSLMHAKRTDFDFALVKAAMADDTLPFLGICAGCQALNISQGGSLTQDIPSMKPGSKIKHSSPNGWQNGFNKHGVEIAPNSKIANALKETRLNVVTSHHQCVDVPGKDFTITARSEDGVVEAIEKNGNRFVVGVQWHPERDFQSNSKLFEEFIRQASLHLAARHAEAK